MKVLSFYFKGIILVSSLLFYLPAGAQTVLKLESNSSQPGIEFDVPIRLQIPWNNKFKPIFVGAYKVSKSLFKLRLNNSISDKDYYSKVLGDTTRLPKPVPLSSNDKVDEVKVGNSVKYLLTFNTPIYFDPNVHYEIGVFSPFICNDKYAEKLRNVLVTLVAAHNKLPKPRSQEFSDEELTLTRLIYIDDSVHFRNDTIKKAWGNLKARYASNGPANSNLIAAIALYDRLYQEVLNDFGYTPIPERDTANVDFYKVYESIIPLIKLSGDYKSLANFNDTFPDFSQNSCLYDFLKRQLSCISCDQHLPSAGIIKDTSGLNAFIIDLLQINSKSKSFIDDQVTIIKVDSILKVFDNKDEIRLRVILEKLEQVKLIMDFARLSSKDACNPTLPDKINMAYTTVKGIIETRHKETKLKEQFDSLLAINESYLNPDFFSLDTYVYNVDTRYGLRLTPDIGVVDYGLIPKYDYNPGHIVPYVGIQLNFRYTKSNIPFTSIPGNRTFSLRHFSAFLGVTLFTVEQPGKTDNLFGKSSPLLGLGYRFIPEIRMVIGTMLVKKIDPNPLISSTKTGALPFIGISFDMNKILGDFIKTF